MEAEQRGAKPLDFDVVRNDLDRRLQAYRTPVTDEIRKLIVVPPEAFDEDECVDQAAELLSDFAGQHVTAVKSQACSGIIRAYPASSDNSPNLESPNQFMKSNGLDGSMRPALRQAQVDTISESRERLIAGIKQDRYHEECDLGVTDEQLRQSTREYEESLIQKITELSQKVQELMPEMPAPVGRLGWVAMYAVGYRRHSSPTVINIPDNGPELTQLEGALFGLRNTLTELEQGAGAAVKHIAQEYEPTVAEHLDKQLEERYQELESGELQSLPAALSEAYQQEARTGCQYKPSPSEPEIIEETDQPTTLEPEADTTGTVKEVSLGEVESPFEWLPDSSIQLSGLRSGDKELLFCDAMPAFAKELSGDLYSDVRLAKKFPVLWGRIKEVELQGHALGHNQIRSVQSIDFHGLTVCYFSNNTRNAARVYYASAGIERFPSIAERAKASGFGLNTQVVILLAETDKVHQLKVYNGLGARWKRGVGST
jgi:hypothetical protein